MREIESIESEFPLSMNRLNKMNAQSKYAKKVQMLETAWGFHMSGRAVERDQILNDLLTKNQIKVWYAAPGPISAKAHAALAAEAYPE